MGSISQIFKKFSRVFNKRYDSKKGFTLIELIIVIAILGILAMITVPKLNGIKEEAKEKADLANAKIIANATAILMAQDKITSDISHTSVNAVLDENTKHYPADLIEGYLQEVPIPQEGGRFAVDVDVSTGKIEVYRVKVDFGKNKVSGSKLIYP
ncbi:type II secretion system protein G precursor [Clostridium tepidiprofundi DSM 19306]|uniref:Type II secretion system protein G n=1 Tax=Clostridium tepidiprofundi DSM 19306 TaxID=1121338 RepID=A0A151B607_9CLOT|nr:prepilin-type N-terminal cleavage/methylation domain-containing protein [Clostridium tepidiprofundi]KYH35329.1 type II secretion system protein G precursor [Clostridium tepidiprofundi DSM 19306]